MSFLKKPLNEEIGARGWALGAASRDTRAGDFGDVVDPALANSELGDSADYSVHCGKGWRGAGVIGYWVLARVQWNEAPKLVPGWVAGPLGLVFWFNEGRRDQRFRAGSSEA